MLNLTITLFFVALLFYLQEAVSENPSVLRGAVFLFGAIEACVSMAFSPYL